MKKASRSAMQKWRPSTSKAMRSIPNGITPSSHGATKPQVEALILPRRLSVGRRGDQLLQSIVPALELADHIRDLTFRRPRLGSPIAGWRDGDYVDQTSAADRVGHDVPAGADAG